MKYIAITIFAALLITLFILSPKGNEIDYTFDQHGNVIDYQVNKTDVTTERLFDELAPDILSQYYK